MRRSRVDYDAIAHLFDSGHIGQRPSIRNSWRSSDSEYREIRLPFWMWAVGPEIN